MRGPGQTQVTRLRRTAETRQRALWRQWHQGGGDLAELPRFRLVAELFQTWNAVGASESQARANAAMVRRFARAQRIRRPDEITTQAIQAHLRRLHDRGLAAGTIHHHRNAIRKFCRYCMIQGWLDHNPAHAVEVPRIYLPPPQYLGDDQIARLRTALRAAPSWLALAVDTALECGLRLGELRALQASDIRGDHLVIGSEQAPKTSQWRTVPLSAELAEGLAKLAGGQDPPFPRGDAATWVRCLAQYADFPPFAKRPGRRAGRYWHLLRSTWAVCRARAGASIWQLMAEGGWRNLQTVLRYVNIAQAAQKTPPAHTGAGGAKEQTAPVPDSTRGWS